MGLFLCHICNEQLGFENPHKCDPETIRKYVGSLQDAARLAERRLDDMQNAVFMLIHELPSLEGEEITVKTKWLTRLWEATKCRWYEAETKEQFLVCWMATHRILCEAFDLFRDEKHGKKETLLQKLVALKEACTNAQEFLGYKDSKLHLSPEDICKNLA